MTTPADDPALNLATRLTDSGSAGAAGSVTSASVGNGSTQYTASYDASGNMTCRAPTSSATCSGASRT